METGKKGGNLSVKEDFPRADLALNAMISTIPTSMFSIVDLRILHLHKCTLR